MDAHTTLNTAALASVRTTECSCYVLLLQIVDQELRLWYLFSVV
jgi:hypothetical protein